MANFNLFPSNKYSKWYKELCESRKKQKRIKFKTEEHHIFPISLYGNSNDTVNLTFKEHYVAHLLLWKLFEETKYEYKMAYALKALQTLTNTDNNRVLFKIKNSRLFAKAREAARKRAGEITKERWDNDPEYRAKMTKANQDYWAKEESKNKQSEKRKKHLKNKDNYNKMVATNRRITSTEGWWKQRSEKQKELHNQPGYTKKRTDAMMTPEAREKSATNSLKAIRSMSDAERKRKFTRPRTAEQIAAHGNKIRGRKKVINLETKQVKVVKPDDLTSYYNNGWMLKTKYSELQVTI